MLYYAVLCYAELGWAHVLVLRHGTNSSCLFFFFCYSLPYLTSLPTYLPACMIHRVPKRSPQAATTHNGLFPVPFYLFTFG